MRILNSQSELLPFIVLWRLETRVLWWHAIKYRVDRWFEPQMTLFKQFTRQLPKLNLFHSRNQLPVLYRHNSSNKRHRKLTQNLLNMSKSHGPSSTTKDKLRHVRYREHIGGKLPVPGKIELQVIGSGGRGTPRSVILATDHVR